MLIGLQLVTIIFVSLMGYLTFLNYKRKDITKLEAIIWFILWFGLLFTTIFPQSLKFILQTFHIVRVMDFLMIIAFMILTIFVFLNFVTIKKIQKKIEKIVREKALKRIK